MGNLLKGAAGLLGVLAAAEAAGTAYFYRRTMKRYNAKTERTMKMSGVDWEQYFHHYAQEKRLDDGTASSGGMDPFQRRPETPRHLFQR